MKKKVVKILEIEPHSLNLSLMEVHQECKNLSDVQRISDGFLAQNATYLQFIRGKNFYP